MSKKLIHLYLILYLLYQVSGIAYPNSFLTTSISLFILTLSIFFLVKVWSSTKPKFAFVKAWTFFLILNIFSLLIINETEINKYVNFKLISIIKIVFIVNLGFYVFYFAGSKNLIGDLDIIKYFIFLYVINLIQYYYAFNFINSDGLNLQINDIYGIVYLLPIIVLLKRNFSIILLLLNIYLVLFSLKRGAFITFSFTSLVFILNAFKIWQNRTKAIGFIILVGFLLTSGFLILELLKSESASFERFSALEYDNGSGRMEIYDQLLDVILKRDELFDVLFGSGFTGSIQNADNLAHNEFLEILINLGIIGVLTLFLMLYYLYKISKIKINLEKSTKINSYKLGVLLVFIIWVIDGSFHRFYNGLYTLPTIICLGYFVGKIENGYYKISTYKLNRGVSTPKKQLV